MAGKRMFRFDVGSLAGALALASAWLSGALFTAGVLGWDVGCLWLSFALLAGAAASIVVVRAADGGASR